MLLNELPSELLSLICDYAHEDLCQYSNICKDFCLAFIYRIKIGKVHIHNIEKSQYAKMATNITVHEWDVDYAKNNIIRFIKMFSLSYNDYLKVAKNPIQSMHVDLCEFNNFVDFPDTVQNLTLTWVEIYGSLKLPPNLKELILMNNTYIKNIVEIPNSVEHIYSSDCPVIIGKCPNLKSLFLKCSKNSTHHTILYNLNNFKSLQKLKVWLYDIPFNFHINMPEIRELIIKDLSGSHSTTCNIDNAPKLESINFHCIEHVNNFKKDTIKSLTFQFEIPVNINEFTNLVSLSLSRMIHCSINIKLLKLKHLTLKYMRFEHSYIHAPNLETFKCGIPDRKFDEYIGARSVQTSYPTIKSDKLHSFKCYNVVEFEKFDIDFGLIKEFNGLIFSNNMVTNINDLYTYLNEQLYINNFNDGTEKDVYVKFGDTKIRTISYF